MPLPFFRGSWMETEVGRFSVCWGMSGDIFFVFVFVFGLAAIYPCCFFALSQMSLLVSSRKDSAPYTGQVPHLNLPLKGAPFHQKTLIFRCFLIPQGPEQSPGSFQHPVVVYDLYYHSLIGEYFQGCPMTCIPWAALSALHPGAQHCPGTWWRPLVLGVVHEGARPWVGPWDMDRVRCSPCPQS